jgi:hypothetical protein
MKTKLQTNELMCLPLEKAYDGVIDCLGGIDEPNLCSLTSHYDKKDKFYCQVCL